MPQDIKGEQVFTYKGRGDILDEVNMRLLEELTRDPRLSMAELGRRIGMSSPAVTERVRRLEEAGVIRGYRLELDPAALGLPIAAFVRVRPDPGQLPRVAELARSIPEVVECHRITGDDCFILKVHFPAMDQLDRCLTVCCSTARRRPRLFSHHPSLAELFRCQIARRDGRVRLIGCHRVSARVIRIAGERSKSTLEKEPMGEREHNRESAPVGLVRVHTPALPRAAKLLARAFQADPLMTYAFPDVIRRERLLPLLIGWNVRFGNLYGEVYATSGWGASRFGSHQASRIQLPGACCGQACCQRHYGWTGRRYPVWPRFRSI